MFGRKSKSFADHPLVTVDTLERLTRLGRARYEGTVDVYDLWPTTYRFEIQALSPDAQERFLVALLAAVRSVGGWLAYGAEDVVDGTFGSPNKGHVSRDKIFESAIEFQHDIGAWWSGLSPMEQLFWQKRHPGVRWQDEREPPCRDAARITPVAIGEERWITRLTGADDSRGLVVAHRILGRYVLELDYADDDGHRLRDPRDETDDLYELYLKAGRGIPLPGVWADPEFASFLKYPMPRL